MGRNATLRERIEARIAKRPGDVFLTRHLGGGRLRCQIMEVRLER